MGRAEGEGQKGRGRTELRGKLRREGIGEGYKWGV